MRLKIDTPEDLDPKGYGYSIVAWFGEEEVHLYAYGGTWHLTGCKDEYEYFDGGFYNRVGFNHTWEFTGEYIGTWWRENDLLADDYNGDEDIHTIPHSPIPFGTAIQIIEHYYCHRQGVKTK